MHEPSSDRLARSDRSDLDRTLAAMRWAFVALAAAGVVGTALELAMLRHWKSGVQLIPWYTLGVLAAAVVAFVARPSARVVRGVRLLAGLVTLVSLFGVFEHVKSNYDTAPLDYRYTDRWPSMSVAARLWAAASKSVGPSPTLVPLVLAQAAVCLVLATLAHPALRIRAVEAARTR